MDTFAGPVSARVEALRCEALNDMPAAADLLVATEHVLIWWLLGKGRPANRCAPPDLVAGSGA